MSILEDAINRYGGADEAYKQKLKEHVRNGMGYSNYVNQSLAAAKKPLSLNLKGNITPAGVKSLVGGAMDMRNQATESAAQLAGSIDQAAGSIASSQIARGKANQGKTGFENGIAFSPKDPVENKILAYMQNPKNPDGSIKSLQQFESELVNEIGIGEGIEIKPYIDRLIPKDFIGQEDKYSLMAQGFSEKQAEDYRGALRYDQMSAPEKLVFQTQNPEMAKRLETLSANKNVIPDIAEKITDEATGESIPKYSLSDLVNKYPNIPPATIAEYAKPVYNQYLYDDIKKELLIGTLEEAIKAKGGKMNITDYAEFMNTDEYKNFKKAILPMYGGLYSDQELDILIHNQIMNEL